MDTVSRQEFDLSCQDRVHTERDSPIISIPYRQSKLGMTSEGAAAPHRSFAIMLFWQVALVLALHLRYACPHAFSLGSRDSLMVLHCSRSAQACAK